MSLGPRGERAASLAVASLSGGGLALARWLTPDPGGHGTHLQIGLLPCSFLTLTGVPCPLCGATTTWALLADLRWVEGVVNQPFAALLFVLTAVVFGIAAAEVIHPAKRWQRLASAVDQHEGTVAVGAVILLCAGWFYKIATFA